MLKSPFAILAGTIDRHPWAVAGILTAIVLLSASGLSNLSFKSTGYDTFVWEDSPDGLQIEKYNEFFGSENIILLIQGDDVLSTEVLEYLDELASDIENEAYVDSVTGITTVLKAYNHGFLPSSEAETESILDKVPEEHKADFAQSRMITLIGVAFDGELSDRQEKDALGNIRSVIENSDPPPGVTITVSGESAYNIDLQSEMQSEMQTLILGTLVLMVFSIAFLFSYVRYRMLPVAIIAIGVLITFGVVGLAGISITMPVIGSFPVIIGLGIDYGVQFHSRFNDEIRDKSVGGAIYATLTKAGPVHFIAMCTTVLGFLALLSSSIPMTAQFGLVCVIGVIASFFTALILVPLTFRIKGYRPRSTGETESTFMERYSRSLGRFALKVSKNPIPVILVLLTAAVIGIQLDDSVRTNVDANSFVPQDMPAKINLDNVRSIVGETGTFTVMVEGTDVTSPEVVRWIDEFGDYVDSTHNEVIGTESLATLIKEYNDGGIPGTGYGIGRVLQKIPEDKLAAVLEGDMITVLEFGTEELSNPEKRDLANSIRKDLLWIEPPAGISAVPTGLSQITGDAIDNLAISKNQMTALGFGMVLLFLILVYRRFSSLLPVIPVAMVLGWNTLIMYILGIEYTPLTACLGSMTVGLSIDYTILIMERFEEELEAGEEFFTAIQTGIRKIGSAITISGTTTLFGFSTLIFSDFNVISMFGESTVITIFFSLVGGIVVMPAVLSLFYWKARSADLLLHKYFRTDGVDS